MTNEQAQHYTFGENELAAERLRLLAQAFESSSAGLLQQLATRAYQVVLDLGCGPGYTTELVHRILQPALTIGIDRSATLLSLAKQRAPRDGLRFEARDLTQPLLDLPPADLMYCRYVLTHLADPGAVLRSWAQALVPGGVLVLEETSSMSSDDPTFRSYYAHVERLQRHYGQHMYIGSVLPALCAASGYVVISTHDKLLQLPAAIMARLHVLNLDTWRRDAYAQQAFDAHELAALGHELSAVADGTREAPPVQHRLQQLAVRRGTGAAGD